MAEFAPMHARPPQKIMMRIYRGILDSIERNNYDVHSRRARISTPRKLGIVAGAFGGGEVAAAADGRNKVIAPLVG